MSASYTACPTDVVNAPVEVVSRNSKPARLILCRDSSGLPSRCTANPRSRPSEGL